MMLFSTILSRQYNTATLLSSMTKFTSHFINGYKAQLAATKNTYYFFSCFLCVRKTQPAFIQ